MTRAIVKEAAGSDPRAHARAHCGPRTGCYDISITPTLIVANLNAARKAKGGMLVAEFGEVVDCCGWAITPSIHRGLIGRLTVLIVDKRHRRYGFAMALLTAAEQALSADKLSLLARCRWLAS